MSEIFTPEERRAIRREQRRRRRRNRTIITSLCCAAAFAVGGALLMLARDNHWFAARLILETEAAAEATEPAVPEDTSAVLSFTGDIMLSGKLRADSRDTELTDHDQSLTYTYAGTSMEEADYLVGNLEVTLSGEFSDWPHFSADDGLAVTLKDLGFDLLTTANNHSMDLGFDALDRTLDVLDRTGISHIGTYRSQEELDRTHGVFTADINGISVTFLDYTYGSNLEWDERPYALSCYNRTNQLQGRTDLDTDAIAQRMAYARSLNSDLIIVLIHWGVEYKTAADEDQNQIADFFLTQGADAIIGGHAHVPQNMEYRTVTDVNGRTRTGFVCYSLGNHISDFKDKYTYLTAYLNLHVKRENGETAIDSVDYTPMYMLKVSGKEANRYLIDSCAALKDFEEGNTAGLLTEKTAVKVQKGVDDLRSIFGEEWTVRPTGRLERE